MALSSYLLEISLNLKSNSFNFLECLHCLVEASMGIIPLHNDCNIVAVLLCAFKVRAPSLLMNNS